MNAPVPIERPRARCLRWRPLRRGSLVGFADVQVGGIVFNDVAVHQGNGGRWAAPAGIPVLDSERRQTTDAAGKLCWKPSIGFANNRAKESFRQAVFEALADAGLQPFDGESVS
jgi:hypothetical protein